jgi:hypothetical protein
MINSIFDEPPVPGHQLDPALKVVFGALSFLATVFVGTITVCGTMIGCWSNCVEQGVIVPELVCYCHSSQCWYDSKARLFRTKSIHIVENGEWEGGLTAKDIFAEIDPGSARYEINLTRPHERYYGSDNRVTLLIPTLAPRLRAVIEVTTTGTKRPSKMPEIVAAYTKTGQTIEIRRSPPVQLSYSR